MIKTFQPLITKAVEILESHKDKKYTKDQHDQQNYIIALLSLVAKTASLALP
jgi:hypothetical protein